MMITNKKGKEYLKRTGSIVMCAALVCTLTACGTDTAETQVTKEAVLTETEAKLEKQLTKQLNASHSSTDGKEETVYVLADANGNTQKVIVSDWLKNGKGDAQLLDCTDLPEVENVKGEESFTRDGEKLNWQAEGADIYYQGTSEKQLPVEVKLSYTLDGKEITPEELAGKSGKVTIRMDYINHSSKKVVIGGKETEIPIPFVLLSGVILPEDTFSNISVTNGKVVSEGSNSIVVGMAAPGLKDALQLDDLKDALKGKAAESMEIPEYIEISADAAEFELGMTMTVAMSDLLSDSSFLQDLSLDDLQDSMNELQNAATQLEDGSVSLKDGADTLADGTGSLAEGAKELKNGAVTLKTGTQELYEKSGELQTGAGQLNTGATALETGITQVDTGIKALQAALETGTVTEDGQQPAILTGAQSVAEASGTLNTLINQYFDTYSKNLNDIINQILQQQQNTGASLAEAKNELADAQAARDAAKASLEQVCNGEVQQIETVSEVMMSDVSGGDSQVTTVVNDITVCQPEVLKNAAQVYSDSEARVAACQANVSALEAQASELEVQLAQMKAFLASLGMTEEQVQQGLDIAVIKVYASQLNQGASALNMGLQQLDAGVRQLADTEKGVPALKAGAAALHTGTAQLQAGTGKLVEGTNTLNSGAATLQAGIGTLYDGAAALDDGALELAAGCLTLKDGLFQLDKEGISKLTSLAGDDAQEAVDRLNAVMDAGKEYKTFTQLSDGMDGSVRFIIKTDEVKIK